jgi:hypothetical protein
MPSRDDLELFAALVNINPDSYTNDSKLEQAIYFAAAAVTVGTQAVATPSARAKNNAASKKKNV